MFKKIANDGRILLLLYAATFSIGAWTFYILEDYSILDSFYWASSTMTTVGYGDVTPKTEAGKSFAILYQQWAIVIVLALTIAWVLGKVNPDLYTNEEQIDDDMDREAIKAKLDRLEGMLNERGNH